MAFRTRVVRVVRDVRDGWEEPLDISVEVPQAVPFSQVKPEDVRRVHDIHGALSGSGGAGIADLHALQVKHAALQQDHDRLVVEHAKLTKDHAALQAEAQKLRELLQHAYHPGMRDMQPAYHPGMRDMQPAYHPGMRDMQPAYHPGGTMMSAMSAASLTPSDAQPGVSLSCVLEAPRKVKTTAQRFSLNVLLAETQALEAAIGAAIGAEGRVRVNSSEMHFLVTLSVDGCDTLPSSRVITWVRGAKIVESEHLVIVHEGYAPPAATDGRRSSYDSE